MSQFSTGGGTSLRSAVVIVANVVSIVRVGNAAAIGRVARRAMLA